jgi:hypothetical protein
MVKLLIFIVALMVLLLATMETYEHFKFPGNVNGKKPWYTLKSSLPECNFDGSKFIETPCYSPPGRFYD